MALGWLKNLGKIGLTAAAPFTGGASLAGIPLMDMVGAGGKALQGGSQAAASNRGTKFEGQLDFSRLMADRDAKNADLKAAADNDFVSNTIARETEGRAGRQDAWRKLLSAQRMMSPSQMPNVAGPYAMAQRQPTAMERQGGEALSAEVLARLQGGNPMEAVTRRDPGLEYDPTAQVDLNLLNAGRGEKVSGWLGALLGGLGDYASKRGAQGQPMDERVRSTGYTSPSVTSGMRF
jgi:hypothetical protein